ncbi:hypothetical protein EW146_g4647 [Bondarzewia mesenterica]|uniref:DUF6534 domain-containing protein n=1 Tax=Bondarzewia mesenterica TaxID=1095465 RepID=A0A4S4LU16_9AGAM|nr:hypothetical protein EW146_g4647 [Bondarzewia mesenterica]
MLIGTFFNLILFGVSSTQIYLYAVNYKEDPVWKRSYIWVLYIVNTANTILEVVFIYDRLINHFGDYNAQGLANWGPALTGIIGMMVQLFFGWRIKILTNNMWTFISIATLAVLECLAAVTTSIIMLCVSDVLITNHIHSAVIVWLISTAVVDMLITVILVSFLRNHRTGSPPTDDVLNKIIRLTVQTGLITTICAITDLVLYMCFSAAYHVIFNYPLSKLYLISLLSSLNSRQGWASYSSSTKYIGGTSRPNTMEFCGNTGTINTNTFSSQTAAWECSATSAQGTRDESSKITDSKPEHTAISSTEW